VRRLRLISSEAGVSLQFGGRAVLYLRASTEHQNYSTDHQEKSLYDYAKRNDLDVIRVYRDEGRSGLTLEGRKGLLQLLSEVQSGRADFDAILVYDVSRWGRFQDIDESSYYEYACRRAGISISYCAEPFSNDGSPLAAILKVLKRAMAAEFSRELSAKVFRAQCNFSKAGFKQGGIAGYGLRRLCVSAAGQPKAVMGLGERKNMPTDRVTYALGSHNEVAIVRRIYEMYLNEHRSDTAIARRLNAEGVPSTYDKPWSSYHVKAILTNEKYAGTMIFNRGTQRLKSSRRPNNPENWIKFPSAFPAAVSIGRFEAALEERRRRRRVWTDDEMLDGLRDILVENGTVTADLIVAAGLPTTKSYAFRFKSLVAAFEAAGVSGPTLPRDVISMFRLRCATKDAVNEMLRCANLAGASIERITCRTFKMNGVVVRLLCTRCRYERSHPCWHVVLRYNHPIDFIIWIRMDQQNEGPAQTYLLPVADFPNRTHLWPSTYSLAKFTRYEKRSIMDVFGLTRDR
jgi:DNA invertase Pin-like site-specific DNA recombinase